MARSDTEIKGNMNHAGYVQNLVWKAWCNFGGKSEVEYWKLALAAESFGNYDLAILEDASDYALEYAMHGYGEDRYETFDEAARVDPYLWLGDPDYLDPEFQVR